jgi:hypothetical protein
MENEIKGKCFSKCDRGQRNKHDFYQTPYSMTRQFLDRVVIPDGSLILEPCCGNGAIVNILKERNLNIINHDLFVDGIDFLIYEKKSDYIITNPPLSLSTEFILHCKKVAEKQFCLFMPIEYLHGEERYKKIYSIDDGYPLTDIYVFTRRAMLTDEVRPDGMYDTGMVTWAWFVWTKIGIQRIQGSIDDKRTFIPNPSIHWIDNNDFVIRNGRRRLTKE